MSTKKQTVKRTQSRQAVIRAKTMIETDPDITRDDLTIQMRCLTDFDPDEIEDAINSCMVR